MTKRAIKKGWCPKETDLAKLSKTDLMAPIEKVAKLLAEALKPGRTLVTAVRFRDGRMEEIVEAPYTDDKTLAPVEEPKPEEPAKAVTVAKPMRGCPPPDFAACEIQATRILSEFLSPEQREDFAKFNRFITVGPDTGHRYMITSRHARDQLARYQRQMYDLDEEQPYCVHDDNAVPAAEELLGLHVCLSLPGWETHLRMLTDH